VAGDIAADVSDFELTILDFGIAGYPTNDYLTKN